MHRKAAPLVNGLAIQPGLDLPEGSIDPASETALRAAYERTNWRRRGITCAYALSKPALRTILRIHAEIAARTTKPG